MKSHTESHARAHACTHTRTDKKLYTLSISMICFLKSNIGIENTGLGSEHITIPEFLWNTMPPPPTPSRVIHTVRTKGQRHKVVTNDVTGQCMTQGICLLKMKEAHCTNRKSDIVKYCQHICTNKATSGNVLHWPQSLPKFFSHFLRIGKAYAII